MLSEIIEVSTAFREVIRSGGSPEDNSQWTSHLAKNLADGQRREKSPIGTPQSHQLEKRTAQGIAPPLRIPLDLRLTDEKLRLRAMRENLEKLSNVVANLVEDESMNAAVDLLKVKPNEDEVMQAAAVLQKDGGNQSSSSGKEEADPPNEGQANSDNALLTAFEQACIGLSENEEVCHPNLEAEEDFLNELENRSKLGLLDTLEDTYVAFRTLLGEVIDGKEDMYIPHSFTINLTHLFFQRMDPFNVMIKNDDAKQNEMMEKQVERCKKEMDYLQKKLRENLHEDTKAIVKFMKEDNDTKEKELVAL